MPWRPIPGRKSPPLLLALIADIEAFLAKHKMTESHFGMLFIHDPHFVAQLRQGRDIRLSTEWRTRQFMEWYRPPRRPKN